MGAAKKSPAELAAACFAIARSSCHPAERAAADTRARAICRRHGLDPADLERAPAARGAPRGRPSPWSAALAALAAARRSAEQWEAGRRALLEETQRAAARDRAHGARRRAELVAAELGEQGMHPLRDGLEHWLVPGDDGLDRLDHAGLVELGRQRLQVAA